MYQNPDKKICPFCNKENAKDAKYCAYCGARLDIFDEKKDEGNLLEPSKDVFNDNTSLPGNEGLDRNSKYALGFSIGAVLLSFFIIPGYIFIFIAGLYRSKAESESIKKVSLILCVIALIIPFTIFAFTFFILYRH